MTETKPTFRPAHNYEPAQKPQGYFVDQMREYGKTEIPNEDAATMRCSIFTDLNLACVYIGANEGIRKDRVYPGLRMLGYNRCYNQMKSDCGDVFSEISDMLRTLRVTRDRDVLLAASTDLQLFTDVRSVQFRVTKQVTEVGLKQSTESGIKLSDLNMYHALHGLKVLVENEIDYSQEVDNPIFEDALRVLRRAESTLSYKVRSLTVLMGL